jgi:hypothetical protein
MTPGPSPVTKNVDAPCRLMFGTGARSAICAELTLTSMRL